MLQKRHLARRRARRRLRPERTRAAAPDWGPGKGTRAMTTRAYALWSTRRRRPARSAGGVGSVGAAAGAAAAAVAAFDASSVALLFEPDFLFERALQLVRGSLEFGEALAERPAQFGQFAGAEDDQSDHENDDQLGHADGTKHRCSYFPETEADAAHVIIGTGCRTGQGNPRRRDAQKSLPVRKLSATMPIMRRYRPLPAVVFAIVVSALVGGLFGTQRARDRRQGSRALQDVHRRAERDRVELRRQGRVRPPRLRRDPRHARHARSAFELLRPEGIRADARAAGRALLRHRHLDSGRSTATSPRCSVFEGSPAYKKGIRRGDVIAQDRRRGRQGLDRPSRRCSKLRGPKGTTVEIEIKRRGYEQLIPLE